MAGRAGGRAEVCPDCPSLRPSLSPGVRSQSPGRAKLEKAEILEMTVRFLQELPASPRLAAAPGERPRPAPPAPRASRPSPSAAPSDGYRQGSGACLVRLARALPACGAPEPARGARLLEHLRRPEDSGGSPSPSAPPTPAPSPPASPRGPGLWRPWEPLARPGG